MPQSQPLLTPGTVIVLADLFGCSFRGRLAKPRKPDTATCFYVVHSLENENRTLTRRSLVGGKPPTRMTADRIAFDIAMTEIYFDAAISR